MTSFDWNTLFPTSNDIPETAKLETPIAGRLLIDGELIDRGFPTKTVVSPIHMRDAGGRLTPVTLGETPLATEAQALDALAAAVAAWRSGTGHWPAARMETRIEAVARFTHKLLKHRETVVRLLMWEIAKTRSDSEAEFDRTISYIHDTIEAAKTLDRDASRLHFAQGYTALIRRMPMGVTLCMGPFNYPLNETFTTLIPALIMGNTTVVKVPRFGQLLWDVLLPEFQSCFPAGVVNVINGSGRDILGAVMKSGQIDVLAFIGSSQVANTLKATHPRPNRLRSILGLDAKNPAIILPDAPVDLSLKETIKGALAFNGQRCTALKLVYVHDSIAEQWTASLADRVAQLRVGLPWTPGVQITPLPAPAKPQQIKDWVGEAVAGGACLHRPESALQGTENLITPAVVSNVARESALAQIEQFGPVIPVVRYSNIEDVTQQIVDSPFGMQASLFGCDPVALGGLIDALSNQVARINLNSACQRGPDVFPFTGRKDSAEGTLSVHDALRAFSLRTMVATGSVDEGKNAFKDILERDSSNFLTNHVIL